MALQSYNCSMKITLVALSSLDGKLTRGNDPDISSWASVEDHEHFNALIARNEVVIMGNKTYEAARKAIERNPHKRRIIMSRHPERMAAEAVNGKREFTAESPFELTQRLRNEKITRVLVVGGGEINALFLAAGLIDELYLTLEPLLFGRGISLAGNQPLSTNLKLLSSKQLNSRGSMLLHYIRS